MKVDALWKGARATHDNAIARKEKGKGAAKTGKGKGKKGRLKGMLGSLLTSRTSDAETVAQHKELHNVPPTSTRGICGILRGRDRLRQVFSFLVMG